MTKKCVQCGKKFTLTDSEMDFFKKKNLSLPKRCKQCRQKNKMNKNNPTSESNTYGSYYVRKPISFETVCPLVTAMVVLAILFFNTELTQIKIGISVIFLLPLFVLVVIYLRSKVFIDEFDTSYYKYTFYDNDSMVKHYAKHKKQTSCNSMENYLYKANIVITDKKNTSKKIQKDGDTAYFNKKTNEFVVVAKAGYIRTYFLANERYFNRQ